EGADVDAGPILNSDAGFGDDCQTGHSGLLLADDFPFQTSLKQRASLLVALDDAFRTHGGLVRVLPRFATRPSLAQQIPALVKRNLDRPKLGNVFIRRRRARMGALQRVLIFDELADPLNNLDLVHASVLSRR